MNFRAGSTFPVPVCTVPSSMDRTSRCNKVDTVRLYASYRLNLLLLKGQRCVKKKIFRAPLLIGICHPCTESRLKSRLQSLSSVGFATVSMLAMKRNCNITCRLSFKPFKIKYFFATFILFLMKIHLLTVRVLAFLFYWKTIVSLWKRRRKIENKIIKICRLVNDC